MTQTENSYQQRYSKLNPAQKTAVDQIEGPLLVVAGPGTGKTELLSMRAANILKTTDILPSNILCLTFTDSGANAMRKRLSDIIGADAYKVAIHTFHSFGSDIISRYNQHFYNGADLEPADELVQHEIVQSIFDELDYSHPLAVKRDGDYIYIKDSLSVISELKRNGITSQELQQVLAANQQVISTITPAIASAFSSRVSMATAEKLAEIATECAKIPQPELPPAITPYANVLALSIAHAVDEATASNSTKPITAWKKQWCTKSVDGQNVLKDHKAAVKIEAMVDIYHKYLTGMEKASRYDYDDMILQLVQAMENQTDLRAELQETYQYIMIDEFQDTNLAQLRIILSLTQAVERPNIMAVGDDDQAIYSFQGADINNIHRFRSEFKETNIVVLTDNYRSAEPILGIARSVITQGSDRLENSIEGLSKQLTPHQDNTGAEINLTAFPTRQAEFTGIAQSISKKLADGVSGEDITVIARRHHELMALLPYLNQANIAVNYEWRDDALSHPVVTLVEKLLRILDALRRNAHDEANNLLPEILSHPAFGYQASDLYKLSLASYRNNQDWLEVIQTTPVFKPFGDWLLVRSSAAHTESFEQQIDALIGVAQDENQSFVSPLASFFFGQEVLSDNPDQYLEALEALRTIRDAIRAHYPDEAPSIALALAFIDARRQLGSPLSVKRSRAEQLSNHINLMSAHKSKGLEFDHVYVIGAVDNAWGENVRSKSRLIRYPANLPLAPVGDNYDERIRLFYVAITRAKRQLELSYSQTKTNGQASLPASFLVDTNLETAEAKPQTTKQVVEQVEVDWRGSLRPQTSSLKDLLASQIDNYKLSITHLNNYIDLTRGGPLKFLTNNLLRFPQAKNAAARYGTVVHTILQQSHDHVRLSGNHRPIEDILGDFERLLTAELADEPDFEDYLHRGSEALSKFLGEHYHSFNSNQRSELGFGTQQVMVGEAHLTGKLDLVDINDQDKTIVVTDYKTGKPSSDWKGKADYEKVKLHKYRQQLMFYQLMIENSRDYSKYKFERGVLSFVEPDQIGEIHQLDGYFSPEELAEFKQLIMAIWKQITSLELPNTDHYSADYKGILEFERDLIDNKL